MPPVLDQQYGGCELVKQARGIWLVKVHYEQVLNPSCILLHPVEANIEKGHSKPPQHQA